MLPKQGLALSLFCFLTVESCPAVEQFSERVCAQLQYDLEKNRQQQRAGYPLAQSDRIKNREYELEQQLNHHCVHPVQDSANRQEKHSKLLSKTHPKPAKKEPSTQFLSSVLEVKAAYQGPQQQAWLEFYQEPWFCYGVRHTAKIVACAERRALAQKQFEAQYPLHSVSLTPPQPQN